MKKSVAELAEVMELALANWGEKIVNPFWVLTNGKMYGYELAAYVLCEIVRQYGEYNPNYGGVSYHAIKLKTPIAPEELSFSLNGNYPALEVRVNYWSSIMLFDERGFGSGGKHMCGMNCRAVMKHIVETLS